MKGRLIGVITVLMAVSLVACMPTTEKQKRETIAVTTAKSQEDMVPPSTGGASDKAPDLNVMPVATISVYHGGGGGLAQDTDSFDAKGLDTQLLAGKLIEYGAPTDGMRILSFDVESRDENVVGILDLSQTESVERCPDKTFLIEIGSTFTEDFELPRPELKVNGVNYEGDDIKQGDSNYFTYNVDYESVEQISERGGCP